MELTKEESVLRWGPVKGVQGYHLDIALDHVFVGVVGTFVHETEYDLRSFINDETIGNSYYYRVVPRFPGGRMGSPRYGIIRLP